MHAVGDPEIAGAGLQGLGKRALPNQQQVGGLRGGGEAGEGLDRQLKALHLDQSSDRAQHRSGRRDAECLPDPGPLGGTLGTGGSGDPIGDDEDSGLGETGGGFDALRDGVIDREDLIAATESQPHEATGEPTSPASAAPSQNGAPLGMDVSHPTGPPAREQRFEQGSPIVGVEQFEAVGTDRLDQPATGAPLTAMGRLVEFHGLEVVALEPLLGGARASDADQGGPKPLSVETIEQVRDEPLKAPHVKGVDHQSQPNWIHDRLSDLCRRG